MTYKEKLEELTRDATHRLKLYSKYSKKVMDLITRNIPITNNQLREKDKMLSKYHLLMNEYTSLLEHINNKRLRFDHEYKKPE